MQKNWVAPIIKHKPPFWHTSANAEGHDSIVGPGVVIAIVVVVDVVTTGVVVVVVVVINGVSQKKPVNAAVHVPFLWDSLILIFKIYI